VSDVFQIGQPRITPMKHDELAPALQGIGYGPTRPAA